jgi:hypothetical protein
MLLEVLRQFPFPHLSRRDRKNHFNQFALFPQWCPIIHQEEGNGRICGYASIPIDEGMILADVKQISRCNSRDRGMQQMAFEGRLWQGNR